MIKDQDLAEFLLAQAKKLNSGRVSKPSEYQKGRRDGVLLGMYLVYSEFLAWNLPKKMDKELSEALTGEKRLELLD